MENNNSNKIEEEIRQYKLYKIQIVEAKIREYENTFNKIKENVVIKFTKNTSSYLIRLLFLLIAIGLLLLGIFFLFPEQATKIMEDSGENFSDIEKSSLKFTLPFLGYIVISVSLLFGFISLLLKKNIRKRNTIYNLSKLVKEVIEYMNETVEEEKKKYEYFVDSIADIERKKRK